MADKDVYQIVTDRIVAMLESADHGAWKMPWHRVAGANPGGSFTIPHNADGRDYRGIKRLAVGSRPRALRRCDGRSKSPAPLGWLNT